MLKRHYARTGVFFTVKNMFGFQGQFFKIPIRLQI